MKYLIFIGIGFILGFGVRECTDKPCPEIIESIDSARKTLPAVVKETEKPQPARTYRKTGTTRPQPAQPDTSRQESEPALLSRYEINVYLDTLIDSAGTIISEDSVRGELLKKKVTFIPNFLTVKETKVIQFPVPQNGIFLGIEAGTNFAGRSRIAPEIEYLNKKGMAYSYNYDLINGVHSVGVKKKVF